ncbi:hypothetical protein [Thalassotalea sp. G2M2-11]|uniref:hypothetical protein n=1 Tax=Thalassotalea sp. G2M2-11 TaxID=2787627 RepID=UPI0019D232D4|nr:hypothetical protein [Thalassotalea sp. G2M2-11]
MTRQGDANNREKTLGENIVMVVFIALLMSVFLYYFFKQEREFTQVGFDVVATNFSSKVTAIRAQWFMDNQPDTVLVKEPDGAILRIKVNERGWVDFTGFDDACQQIWRALVSDDFSFINQPVAVLMVQDSTNSLQSHCRFSLPSGEYFDYFFANGKVANASMQ